MTAAVAQLVNQSTLDKVESFLNDPLYVESIESSVNYNTRLCIERRMRLPFIDTQTGVAQNHSSLFMHKRQRIPGLSPGQIYSYPRPRWRKKRRQYLVMNSRAFARAADSALDGDVDIHNISQLENPALQDQDSKDSQLLLKDDVSKDWFYDDQDILEMDNYEEPDPDSDLDYEETYSKRTKRRKTTGRGRGTDSPSTPGRKKGGGRGRKKATHSFEPTPGDPDKPFACELCGARYKTRPGLTYHYGHSHKEGASDENSRDSNAPTPSSSQLGAALMQQGPPQHHGNNNNGNNVVLFGGGGGPLNTSLMGGGGLIQGPILLNQPPMLGGLGDEASTAMPQGPAIQGHVYQDSYVSFLNQTPGTPSRRGRQPNNPQQQPPPPPPPLPPPPPPPSSIVPQPQLMQPPPIQQHPLPPPPHQQQPVSNTPPTLPPNLPTQPSPPIDDPPMPILLPEKIDPPPSTSTTMMDQQQQHHQQLQHQHQQHLPAPPPPLPPPQPQPSMGKEKAAPSPYCDFCLGDSRENKKTGVMEELVSCSDCGRSGKNGNRSEEKVIRKGGRKKKVQ